MDLRFLVAFVLVALLIDNRAFADFWYNHPYKQYSEPGGLEERNLKCVPGRTTTKISQVAEIETVDSESEERIERRSHMNSPKVESETCEICVCSAEGKDEYCTQRPAMNVNECLRVQTIMEEFNKNVPFGHERDLSQRMRRDYIYHDDEIPYRHKARCMRSHSYYTSDPNANNTDIDQPSDVNSYLDYKGGEDFCFYCVCSINGNDIYCVRRDLWFCEYYRYIRESNSTREMYSVMFKQDRPGYFQQLSWRLRRTMDDGLHALIERGGDTLCCNHPSGHRRSLHNQVRNKVWQSLRRKTPKENLMDGSPVGDYVDFVVNND